MFLAVFIVAGFGLGKVEKARAGYCVHQTNNTGGLSAEVDYFTSDSESACKKTLTTSSASGGGDSIFVGYTEDKAKADELKSGTQATLDKNSEGTIGVGQKTEDVCGIGLLDAVLSLKGIKCLLLYVLKFIGALIVAASTLFVWVIDTANMKAVLDNSVIYELWGFVRDMLNVAFILVLLFSAFCTVFQISKYSYKSLLVTLIIMALLVNFSFPIARVIIDFSNVIMYYLINGLGSNIKDGKIFIDFANNGGLADIVNPKVGGSVSVNSDMSFLIAAIVFTFMFMVTLIIIAILLLIRIVVLAILIIFASIAFVGSIVPFLSKYASEWWDTLFKYAFFGPVMIFMMVVATKMMGEIAKKKGQMSIIATAQTQPEIAKTIAAFAFFSIPIVILWVGIGSAQKMSIAGAGAIVGRGEKFMKWVGRGTYKAPWMGFKATGIPGGVQQRYGEIKNKFKSSRESREARMATALGSKSAEERDMKKQADEYKKEKSLPELQDLAKKGDAAAAYALADLKEMDSDVYNEFLRNTKGSTRIKSALDAKVKQNRTDVVAISKAEDINSKEYQDIKTANPLWTPDMIKYQVIEDEMGKMTAEKWGDQNWAVVDKKLTGPNRAKLSAALLDSYISLKPQAQGELSKRLSSANVKALRNLGVPI